MTSNSWFEALVPLVEDLSRELAPSDRYQRLLGAVRQLFPCDATALLRLDEDMLVPLAVDGLSQDTMGRRFKVADHPRFVQLLSEAQPYQFPDDSKLPDPYDGLVEGLPGRLEVHDCVGCALRIDGRTWGLLTLDSLHPRSFTARHLGLLKVFAGLAAATVGAAMRIEQLQQLAQREQMQTERYRRASGQPDRQLLGHSAPLKNLRRDIDLVAPSELTVLISGETGVGKELVAQALHARSRRADRPLVSLNCAALPETLVESELFGHVRGAFTGAVADRRGKFELADGGTLFLDEVGELPMTVQAKLLRVLQSGQLQRLGSDREHRVDVRLIVGTNRDLAAEVRAGRIRADIYHRLSVYPLKVPPLRERGRDVLLLAGFFLEENRSRLGLGGVRLDASAQDALLRYDWPGNVRELEHLIGRSTLKALGRHAGARPRLLTLTAYDIGLEASGTAAAHDMDAGDVVQAEPAGVGLRQRVDEFERQLIAQALSRHGNSWAAAARELQIDRANLARMARRHGLASAPRRRP